MTLPPRLRKLVLIAHITTAVGWLGAVIAFLALNVAALTNQDAQVVSASYLAMEWTTLYAIVPLSLASLLIGVIQSLGTTWSPFRHYWVFFKLLINVFANVILLQYTQTLSAIVAASADTRLSGAELRGLAVSPMIHASGALLLLLVATALSVYKPRGLTPYGLRKQRELRALSRPQA